jgi:hypothetical protein
VQVRCYDRRQDRYHGTGQVRTKAGLLGQERATRNDKEGSNQGKIVVGADQGHAFAASVRK